VFPRVSIIILNWNGWEDTIECLESLYQITYPNYEVIVVDNNSEDNSIEKIKEYCEGKIKVESKFFEYDPNNKPIYVLEYTREQAEKGGYFRKEKYFSKLPSNRKLRLILNEKNYGFSEGNNIGMRYALKVLNPDYVLLLNNDTVVDPEFLSELIKIGGDDEKIGVLGPKIYYYSYKQKNNVFWVIGTKINWWTGYTTEIGYNEIDFGQYDKIMEFDAVSGCAMLIKTSVLQKVGLLDSDFFLGAEDLEFCTRVRKIGGFKVVYVPYSKIWHKVSRSREKVIKNPDVYSELIKNIGMLGAKKRFKFYIKYSKFYQLFFQIAYYGIIMLPLRVFQILKKHGIVDSLKFFVRFLLGNYRRLQ